PPWPSTATAAWSSKPERSRPEDHGLIGAQPARVSLAFALTIARHLDGVGAGERQLHSVAGEVDDHEAAVVGRAPRIGEHRRGAGTRVEEPQLARGQRRAGGTSSQ